MITLRPYQVDAVEQIKKALSERQKVLLVAPTGSGKTEIASAVIKHKVEQYKSVLFLAHRREIILQASAKRLAPGERDDNFGSGLIDPLKALQLADPRTATTTPTIRQR